MERARRAATLLAVALLLLSIEGCKWFELTVKISDFDSRQVQGVWMWRKDAATGQWQRAGQIVFQSLSAGSLRKGATPLPTLENLEYIAIQPDGSGLPMRAAAERDPNAPDQVTVRLWYNRFLEPGEYRMSAYNESGESSLSPETLELL